MRMPGCHGSVKFTTFLIDKAPEGIARRQIRVIIVGWRKVSANDQRQSRFDILAMDRSDRTTCPEDFRVGNDRFLRGGLLGKKFTFHIFDSFSCRWHIPGRRVHGKFGLSHNIITILPFSESPMSVRHDLRHPRTLLLNEPVKGRCIHRLLQIGIEQVLRNRNVQRFRFIGQHVRRVANRIDRRVDFLSLLRRILLVVQEIGTLDDLLHVFDVVSRGFVLIKIISR